ncbi:MAG TPA: hypothetical protein VHC97_17350 [Thermoanaerobaculia bacterium]|nr:hypothetical protein [Thermoanaerobaculia bacterium]
MDDDDLLVIAEEIFLDLDRAEEAGADVIEEVPKASGDAQDV